MTAWLAWIIGAYLIGSIPFGVMLGWTRGIDIRQHGSKNIGATNVWRVLGKKLGAVCFVLDFAKGAGPVIASGVINGVIGRSARELSQQQMWLWLAVVGAAIVGHMLSVFLGFRGGKGVATGLGAVSAMWPLLTLPALGAIVVWYGTLRLTRYVSIASILAVSSIPIGYLLTVIPPDALEQSPLYTWQHLVHAAPPFIGATAIAALVIYKHRGNLERIRRGQEPRAGETRDA